jgi:ribose 5-phosphate isomerase RpiB
MKIAIGSDHAGFDYKEHLRQKFTQQGFETLVLTALILLTTLTLHILWRSLLKTVKLCLEF